MSVSVDLQTSNLTNIGALTMADQILLSALAPFTIMFTLCFGRFLLQEEILIKHYIACFFMGVGSILALIFSSKHAHDYNIHQIRMRILRPLSLIVTSANLVIFLLIILISVKIIRDIKKAAISYTPRELDKCLLKNDHLWPQIREDWKSVSNAWNYSGDIRERRPIFRNPNWLKLAVFSFPWFAGFMSGMTSLFAKCTIMLLSHFGKNSHFALTYIIPILLLLSAVMEILSLNLGFKYFDTAVVVPIFKASIVFHNTMWGGILLAEFYTYSTLSTIMYILGIAIWIIGILIMLVNQTRTRRTLQVNPDEEEGKKSLLKDSSTDE